MSDKKKKLRWQLPFLALLIVGTVIILSKQDRSPYHTNQGMVFGTVYKITYQYAEDLQNDIKTELDNPHNEQWKWTTETLCYVKKPDTKTIHFMIPFTWNF